MFRKLSILLMPSKLKVTKLLIYTYFMHNLYAIFVNFLDVSGQRAGNMINAQGSILHVGEIRLSDLEVIALTITSEAIGIDNESYFFVLLQEYKKKLFHLISRRQYSDRCKFIVSLQYYP